jgi:hypothetical protein
MNRTILLAIRERRLLCLHYAPGMRIVQPCAYGRSSEGNDLLRAFQTSGASASGEHVHWKLFRVDRIQQMQLLLEQFLSPPLDYHANDKAMRGGIYCQL